MFDPDAYQGETLEYDEDSQPREGEIAQDGDSEAYCLHQHDGQESTQDFELEEALEHLN